MLYKKLTPQNDSVFQAHNECMKECHEETGALGSNLAKKEQQHGSKDMVDSLPPMNTCFRHILRSRNYHYAAGLN